MATVERIISSTPEAVDRVLADGWLFPSWVVGASRMREVTDDWPLPGSVLHHSVGTWPVLIDDTTTVLEYSPARLLRLRVRAWPAGEAEVRIELSPDPGGTRVTMEEHPVQGPGHWAPRVLTDPALKARNVETLRRLAFLAEGGAR